MNKEIQPKTEQHLTNQQRLLLLGLNHIPDETHLSHTDKKFELNMLGLFTPILFEPDESFRQEYFQFYTQVTESVICKFSGAQNEPPNPKLLQEDLIGLGGQIGQTFKNISDFEFGDNEYIEEEDRPSYAVSRVCDLMNHIYVGLNKYYDLKSANLARREQISRGVFDIVFPFAKTYAPDDEVKQDDPNRPTEALNETPLINEPTEILQTGDKKDLILAAY